jgi:hypothetical protein
MTSPGQGNRDSGSMRQPSLANLLARHLDQQAKAHAEGVASPDLAGEVVPHDAGLVQAIDAKQAWQEAIAVAKYYGTADSPTLQPPPDWPQVVMMHEPAVALPFCFGNFPQLVRNYQELYRSAIQPDLRPLSDRPIDAPGLVEWAGQASAAKQLPALLLALGALRLAKQFEEADKLVQAHEAGLPPRWQGAWANEKAALAWHRGQFDEALGQWQGMAPSVPVLFNRAMAALFRGRPADVKPALTEAVSQLPDTSAWHHLGQLYLLLMNPA